MKKIIFILLLAPLLTQASFEERSLRYMTPYDLIMSFQLFFPQSMQYGSSGSCTSLNLNNRSFLGDNSVVLGEPISPTPTQALVQWVSQCVIEGYNAYNTVQAPNVHFFEYFIGPAAQEKLEKLLNKKDLKPYEINMRLQYLPDEILKDIIKHQIELILGGDEVILDFGLIKNPQDFKEKLFLSLKKNPQDTVFTVLQKLTTTLMLRDEFLSY